MSDALDPQSERRVDLAQKLSVLSERLERHINEELPLVSQLGEKIAEIRAEQRAVFRDLSTEHQAALMRVQADQQVVRTKLDTNTALTQEVRDILTTFKMVGSFAKWLGAIVAAVGGAWVAIKGVRLE